MKKYNEVFQLDHNSWFDFEEVYDMAVDHFTDGSSFIEIGSWQGASAAYLALKIKELKKDILITCIDLWTGDPNNSNEQRIVKSLPPMKKIFTDNLESLNIKVYDYLYGFSEPENAIKQLHKIDVLSYEENSDFALSQFDDNSIDFIFIDGGHTEHQVNKDIENAKRIIKSGGWIGGHDYPTVRKMVHEQFKNIETFKTSRHNDKTHSSWLVRNFS